MSTLTTIQSTDLITNSRADINGNFSALNADKIETSVLDTDTTLAANSNSKVPTQAAVKAYVDAGGNVNASETSKGIVEEATDAEVTAGTATGGTGAKLFVSPAKLETRLAITPVVKKYVAADSPATWTKPSGLRYITVEVQAAGGAGGAISSAADSGVAGGGSGGYARKLIPAATLGSTETATIGATTSFTVNGGSTITTTTGSAPAANSEAPGAGGTASNGDINIAGNYGGKGNISAGNEIAGMGACSPLGVGGGGRGTSGAGFDGTGYGSGGGGALNSGSSNSYSGGAAGVGIVIVTEYF